MPRGNRLGGVDGVVHVTHRCHNQTHLLRFARDRDTYRRILREHADPYGVSVLDYCLTCNHVHLLLDVGAAENLSGFMREVASEFARFYNQRKCRSNALWGDNYHATAVEQGSYLWECLCYIELNMVRCGVVDHPSEWGWVGYHEIMGRRRRYRVTDAERLCWRLRAGSIEEVRRNLEVSLRERIERGQLRRDPRWTESLAVGSREFTERVQPEVTHRRRTEIASTPGEVWVLREAAMAYGAEGG